MSFGPRTSSLPKTGSAGNGANGSSTSSSSSSSSPTSSSAFAPNSSSTSSGYGSVGTYTSPSHLFQSQHRSGTFTSQTRASPPPATPNRRDSSYAAYPAMYAKRSSLPPQPSSSAFFQQSSNAAATIKSSITGQPQRPPQPEGFEDAQDLLLRLERENASLRLDPKSVLVEEGNLMAHMRTMQTLSEYHLKLSSEMKEEDIAFWNSVIEDHQSSMQKIPHLLIVKIRSGIPPQLRSKIWSLMAGADPSKVETVYQNVLQEDSPAERIIKRDIPRTFPKLDMFKEEDGPGQRSLYNLLKAYSIYDSECGYCQGLSFVVAPLLLQNMSEIEAFSVFVRLMEDSPAKPNSRRYALRSLFTPQMPGLHLILYQHSELVRLCLPNLFAHFVEHGVMADTYASPWFLTLFTYNFPLALVFRIFDIIFAEGATETMLRFSIAILKRNQQQLLQETDLEGNLELLKGDRLYKVYEEDPERVVQDAMSLESVITEAVLEKLVANFHAERKIRSSSDMEVKQLRWEAQRVSAENQKLSKEVAGLQESLRAANERRLQEVKKVQAEMDAVVGQLKAERVKDGLIIEELRRKLALLEGNDLVDEGSELRE
ncbi:rab-GTPase-TBC domain-containing protein [Zopfochytrium polystomum]|nr:rab-GTPase-TBC domain-containing protein [Zopfochytrium polystomum]